MRKFISLYLPPPLPPQLSLQLTNTPSPSLDAVARAAFDYDLDCLAGTPHALAESLDGLTNNEANASSFYMRALFWLFPSILMIGEKGRMIRRSKAELGAIASKMWRDARAGGDSHGRNLIATMREWWFFFVGFGLGM